MKAVRMCVQSVTDWMWMMCIVSMFPSVRLAVCVSSGRLRGRLSGDVEFYISLKITEKEPPQHSDNMQNSLNEKNRHTASAPWSARHHPLATA